MKRIEALTTLRFVFAFTVITYHFGIEAGGVFDALAFNFSPGRMSFFFTLSGFVLMLAYFDRPDFSASRFYAARAARILPLYFLALALTVPFRYGEDIHNLTGLILSATFLQAWVHPYNISFNDPAWSLSVEIFFYALFPLLVKWIHKRNVTPRKLLLIAVAVYLITQTGLLFFINAPFFEPFPSWMYSLAYFLPLSHFSSYLLGMAGGLIYLRNRDNVLTGGFRSYALLAFAFTLDFLSIQYADRFAASFGVDLPSRSSFHALTRLGLILAIAFTNNRITQALSWKPLVLLGGASYAIFILQRPFALIFQFTLKRLHIPLVPSVAGFLMFSITLVGLSVLSYLYFEPAGKRFIYKIEAWIRRIFQRPSPE